MKKYLSFILALFLCIGILSACSNNASTSEISTEASETTTVTSLSEASSEESTKPEEQSQWPRTITDAGENKITLDAPPKRIAILHANYLEYFFALGNPPIASAGASVGSAQKALETYETLAPYKGTAEILDLGSAREINLEAILEAQPDVIVTFLGHSGLDEIYEQLNKIAPVIFLDFSKSWQDQTRDCAEILGQENEAEEIIAKTENMIKQTHEKISVQNKTVAIFRTGGGKGFIGRGNEDYYNAFGLTAPQGYTFDYVTFSQEAVVEMNPDYIIFLEYIDIAKEFVKTQENSSIWNSINAVQNDNVLYFDDSLNTFGPLAMYLSGEKLMEAISE